MEKKEYSKPILKKEELQLGVFGTYGRTPPSTGGWWWWWWPRRR